MLKIFFFNPIILIKVFLINIFFICKDVHFIFDGVVTLVPFVLPKDNITVVFATRFAI